MAFAQEHVLKFHHFGVNQGLSQSNVTCIMQDHLGLMWFGSIDGLNVYDGFKNTIYREDLKKKNGLKGERILSILEIDSNEIAVGTRAGLNIYHRDQDSFSLHTFKAGSQNVNLLKKEKGSLLMILKGKLTNFDLNTKKFTEIQTNFSVQWDDLLKKSSTGKHHSQYLYSRLYDIIEKWPQDYEKISSVIIANEVNDMMHDTAKQVLYLATSGGFLSYDLSTSTISKILIPGCMKSLNRFGDNLVVGSKDSGLYIFSVAPNKLIAHYSSDEGGNQSISGNYVRTLFIDRQLNLWASALGSGINYCSLIPPIAHAVFAYENSFTQIKPTYYIQAMAEDKDNHIWLSDVRGGLFVLDNQYKIIKSFTPEQIDPIRKPFSIQQIYVSNKNAVYLLTEDGLYYTVDHIHFQHIMNENNTVNEGSMFYMIRLSDTVAVLSTSACLIRFNPALNVICTSDTLSVKESGNLFIYGDQSGNIYIAGVVAGINIYRYTGKVLTAIKNIDLKLRLTGAHEEKDMIWFSTSRGILGLNKHTFSYSLLDENDGLTNQYLCALLPDPIEHNAFWCSSHKGIFKYNTDSKHSFPLGLNEGLSTLEFNTNSFAQRKSGDFVFGSIDGITYFNPTKIQRDYKPNELVLFNLKLNNEYPNETNSKLTGNEYSIPYAYNSISFRLMQINFPNRDIQIKYRLEGLEKEWNTGTNPIDIRYPNLREGSYKFVAQYNNRSTGTVEKIFYYFRIHAPWYRTWFAYIIYCLLLVSALWLSGWIYFRRKLKLQKAALAKQQMLLNERNRISADLHDDIGATLSSMNIYGDLAANVWDTKPQESRKMIEKISVTSKDLMNRMGDIIWSMKPADEEKYTLEARLKNYSNELLTPKNIECDFDIEEKLAASITNPEVRKNILLIVKEAINNIAKYSGAINALVSLKQQNETVLLTISDNGKGYAVENIPKGNGLNNIQHRCKQLEGTCIIKPIVGNGVTVVCSFPMTKISHTS